MESSDISNVGKSSSQFDRRMYGALLRHMRMEAGYRKGEVFVADLAEIGLTIPVATLYRYERGDQDPTFEFISAVNLLLFGNTHSGVITDSCVPEEWSQPMSSDTIMRILKRNGAINRISDTGDMAANERASYYSRIMAGINSYDFDVYANDSSTDSDLYMTVIYGKFDDLFPGETEMESYHIEFPEDVERAILHFLKSRNFEISGEEIDKLIQFGKRRMESQLKAYEIV